MSTTKEEFDYPAHFREHGVQEKTAKRGIEARERQHQKVTKDRISICLDQDIIKRFKALVPDGKGYQTLINKALREWLEAQSVEGMLRQELPKIMHQAIKKHSAGS